VSFDYQLKETVWWTPEFQLVTRSVVSPRYELWVIPMTSCLSAPWSPAWSGSGPPPPACSSTVESRRWRTSTRWTRAPTEAGMSTCPESPELRPPDRTGQKKENFSPSGEPVMDYDSQIALLSVVQMTSSESRCDAKLTL